MLLKSASFWLTKQSSILNFCLFSHSLTSPPPPPYNPNQPDPEPVYTTPVPEPEPEYTECSTICEDK